MGFLLSWDEALKVIDHKKASTPSRMHYLVLLLVWYIHYSFLYIFWFNSSSYVDYLWWKKKKKKESRSFDCVIFGRHPRKVDLSYDNNIQSGLSGTYKRANIIANPPTMSTSYRTMMEATWFRQPSCRERDFLKSCCFMYYPVHLEKSFRTSIKPWDKHTKWAYWLTKGSTAMTDT